MARTPQDIRDHIAQVMVDPVPGAWERIACNFEAPYEDGPDDSHISFNVDR